MEVFGGAPSCCQVLEIFGEGPVDVAIAGLHDGIAFGGVIVVVRIEGGDCVGVQLALASSSIALVAVPDPPRRRIPLEQHRAPSIFVCERIVLAAAGLRMST